jgi:hypothetical protein
MMDIPMQKTKTPVQPLPPAKAAPITVAPIATIPPPAAAATNQTAKVSQPGNTPAALTQQPFAVKMSDPLSVKVQKDPTPFYLTPLGLALISFGFGLIAAVISEWLKRLLFRPKLRVRFGSTPDLRVPTIVGPPLNKENAIYVRGLVENRRGTYAKNCRVYLVKVDQLEGTVFKVCEFYRDSLRLLWAYEGESDTATHEGIDIPKGTGFYFDIMASKQRRSLVADTSSSESVNRIIQVAVKSLRYDHERLMNKLVTGTFRFTVVIVCENGAPRKRTVKVNLKAGWNEVEVIPPAWWHDHLPEWLDKRLQSFLAEREQRDTPKTATEDSVVDVPDKKDEPPKQ